MTRRDRTGTCVASRDGDGADGVGEHPPSSHTTGDVWVGKRCRKISPTVLRPAGALRRCRCSLTEQLSWAAVRVYCKGDCGLLLRRNAQALVDSDWCRAPAARVRRRLHRERRRPVQARERREGEKRKGIFSIGFVSLCNKPIIAAHSLLPFPH